jgi:site-specific recombinase XerD
MRLVTCIQQFFVQYLPRVKGVSDRTIKTYQYTFTLFLPFAAQYCSVKIKSLTVNHLSPNLVLAFLDYLEVQRNNVARTRNNRFAAIKSLLRMIRLMYPENQKHVERILNIPMKKTRKELMSFLYPDEIIRVLETVDLKKQFGFRDYTILHLLFDTGARASEIATLNLDYFDPAHKMIAILGKGNCFRLVSLWPKTSQLLRLYIIKYRLIPKPVYKDKLFINQKREELTRHGIYRVCRKYLSRALPNERVKTLNAVHSFRHSRAFDMLASGSTVEEIAMRLGHTSTFFTRAYLHFDLSSVRELQKKLNEYVQSTIFQDHKIGEYIDWKKREEILSWLDSL